MRAQTQRNNIANRYAQALFRALHPETFSSQDITELESLIHSYQKCLSPYVMKFFSSPVINDAAKQEALALLTDKAPNRWKGLLSSFFRVLLLNKRLFCIQEILTKILSAVDHHGRILHVKVVSYNTMSEIHKSCLCSDLAKMFQAHVQGSFSEDASLLGGFVVDIESQHVRLDGSLVTQLERLKKNLKDI